MKLSILRLLQREESIGSEVIGVVKPYTVISDVKCLDTGSKMRKYKKGENNEIHYIFVFRWRHSRLQRGRQKKR
jgi:hypothetical protein